LPRRTLLALVLASVVGALAAAPVVFAFALAAPWVHEASTWLLLPFVVLCPPWRLFWSALGRPDDLAYLLQLGGLVALFNALLYAPLGALYVAVQSLRPVHRRFLIVACFVSLLSLGHFFFMSEPAWFTALLNRVAT
jgi:hypothetical protein